MQLKIHKNEGTIKKIVQISCSESDGIECSLWRKGDQILSVVDRVKGSSSWIVENYEAVSFLPETRPLNTSESDLYLPIYGITKCIAS